MKNSIFLSALLLVSISSIAGATTTTINFGQYTEGTAITTQYSSEGVTFQNATELTVAAGYNSTGYPPPTGSTGVIYDSSPLLTILFTAPTASFSGFYSADNNDTLDEYDSNGNLLGTVSLSSDLGSSDAFSTNVASVSKLVFVDAGGSNGLTLGNISFNPAAVAATPEPSSLMLLGTGLLGVAGAARRRFRKA